MTYEEFFPAADIQAYKRVKSGTMRLARVARGTVAAMIGAKTPKTGYIATAGRAKEFISTPQGLFRLATSHRSDNETERREHNRLGAKTVIMFDDSELGDFFASHGLARGPSLVEFKQRVQEGMAA